MIANFEFCCLDFADSILDPGNWAKIYLFLNFGWEPYWFNSKKVDYQVRRGKNWAYYCLKTDYDLKSGNVPYYPSFAIEP